MQPLTIRKSLVIAFAQRYTNMLLTIPTIMIVSRLLTPAEIGVFSVGMAFVSIVHSMRDFGVTDFLVQSRDLEDGVAQSAFFINVLIATTLAMAVFLSADLVASFYDEDGLATLLRLLSVNFLLLPFATTTDALLRRNMQFQIIYKINLIRQATQSFTTILLAYIGFGYIGLGIGSVAATIALIVASMSLGRDYRIRGIGTRHWRKVANFGVQRTFSDIVGNLGNNAPDFIIGKVIDFTAVGLYSRGKGLINMFRENVLSAIATVTFPNYAKDFWRSDNPHILYLKSIRYVTAISWPFLAFAALMGFPIMRIMFGEQWDQAVPILQISAIGALIGVVNLDAPRLLVAIGRVSTVTKIVVFMQVLRVSLVIVTAHFGLIAVALTQAALTPLGVALYQSRIERYTHTQPMDLPRALYASAWTTLLALAPPIVVVLWSPIGPDNVWFPLVAGAITSLCGWWLGLKLSHHPLGGEIESWFSAAYRRLLPQRS